MEVLLENQLFLLVLLSSVAFFAGVIDAIAGGGGLITIPALLYTGTPPLLALGTNKLAASFGSFTSATTYRLSNVFKIRDWKLLCFSTFIGAIIGTIAVNQIKEDVLNEIIPLFIIFALLISIFKKRIKIQTSAKSKKSHLAQGVIIGSWDGFAGPGTGAFWTISNQIFQKLSIVESIGLAKLFNFISNVVSLSLFVFYGHLIWQIGLSMGVFIILGAFIGSKLTLQVSTQRIEKIFNSLVFMLAFGLILKHWFLV